MSHSLPNTINVVYQDGSLKPEQPLGLPDGTKLKISIVSPPVPGGLDAKDEQLVGEILDDDREVFEALGHAASATSEDRFERELVEAGLLRKRKPADASSIAPPRQLVRIQGKPLSETIVEDRR